MDYRPKIGEDARTKNGYQAFYQGHDANRPGAPWIFKVDGVTWCYSDDGRFNNHSLENHPLDLSGKWCDVFKDDGINCVAEFHGAFGIATPEKPNLPVVEGVEREVMIAYYKAAADIAVTLKNVSAQTSSPLLLRLHLIQEELSELAEAFLNNDIVGALDALTDIGYVVDGTYLTTGLGHYKIPARREVHRSNMTKLDEDGKPVIGASGRIEKSSRYDPPNLRRVLE